MQGAQEDLICRQKAKEALESIYTARESAQIAFDNINNTTTSGGIFLPGFKNLTTAGSDGIVGTADDGAIETLVLPGPDGQLGTSDDQIVTLSNFTRQISITPLYNSGIANPDIRQLAVTIQYTNNKGQSKSYEVDSLISRYRGNEHGRRVKAATIVPWIYLSFGRFWSRPRSRGDLKRGCLAFSPKAWTSVRWSRIAGEMQQNARVAINLLAPRPERRWNGNHRSAASRCQLRSGRDLPSRVSDAGSDKLNPVGYCRRPASGLHPYISYLNPLVTGPPNTLYDVALAIQSGRRGWVRRFRPARFPPAMRLILWPPTS